MPSLTCLHNNELNIPLPDPECQAILDSVRKLTGLDWQVVPVKAIRKSGWFGLRRSTITLYGVYVFVGGFPPWQQINFYIEGAHSSINIHVSLDLVVAYLLGVSAAELYHASGQGPGPV